MDAIPKRLNLKVEHKEDRISSLPEDILIRILSILPTKDAYLTSFLSTRWKYLWTCITNLDFSDESLYKLTERRLAYMKFMNFVDSVLLLQHSNIQTFRLLCEHPISIPRLDPWISAAVKRGVQELDIDIFGYIQPIHLPHSLFTCETLVVLKLKRGLMFPIPSSICLPRLKVLHADIRNPTEQELFCLFCGCPVLEDLSIEADLSRTRRPTIFNITVPTLKRLYISLKGVGYDLRNCVYRIEVDAPILEYFTLKDDFQPSPYLVSEEWSSQDSRLDHSSDIYHLLRKISNVKHLKLYSHTTYGLYFASDVYLPSFHVLSHLKLVAFNCFLLPHLLKSFPNLEVLNLRMDLWRKEGDFIEELDWILPYQVPSCLLLPLKEIKISDFQGWKDQLEMVRYLLANAEALDKMAINFDKDVTSERKMSVRKELSELPVVSKTCHIVFF